MTDQYDPPGDEGPKQLDREYRLPVSPASQLVCDTSAKEQEKKATCDNQDDPLNVGPTLIDAA